MPDCQRLEALGDGCWLKYGPEEIRKRLLRAALHSLDTIAYFSWRASYEECLHGNTCEGDLHVDR